ncbi:MAG: RAMP superfamily CRISPR-associated protein [Ardenticatenaceae bacterium]|nr:RAMP superfamily CRISPR-associated protein [Ardenticatenaceae bacterium]
MIEDLDTRHLRKRYIVRGRLVLETALHVGTGRAVSPLTDSPILRDAAGRPLIPGSSMKGAFRATVERIAPNLPGYWSCALDDDVANCLSPQRSPLGDAYRAVRAYLGRAIPSQPVADDEDAKLAHDALEKLGHPEWTDKNIGEEDLLRLLDEHLCDTCKLFGSPYLASKVHFQDLPVRTNEWLEVTEIRDGVGIDRDSERAVEQIKFDFEVVPSETAFDFGLVVENPTERDLGLLAVGLSECTNGMVRLGGIRSRGLGACRLKLDDVQVLDFSDHRALVVYLKEGALTTRPWAGFLTECIQNALEGLGGSDAQATGQ